MAAMQKTRGPGSSVAAIWRMPGTILSRKNPPASERRSASGFCQAFSAGKPRARRMAAMQNNSFGRLPVPCFDAPSRTELRLGDNGKQGGGHEQLTRDFRFSPCYKKGRAIPPRGLSAMRKTQPWYAGTWLLSGRFICEDNRVETETDEMPDFVFVNHGSIVTLTPMSEAAKEWCAEHLPEDAQRWGANGYVIEPRYFAPIYHGIQEEGLSI